MTRYFFHLRDDKSVLLDDEGTELPDIEAAKREGLRCLGELCRDLKLAEPRSSLAIDIASGNQSALYHLTLTIEAHPPAKPENRIERTGAAANPD